MLTGAHYGTSPARPGTIIPGGTLAADPPAPWPPTGLTADAKVDLLLSYIGPPRYDIVPGDWTLTELILALAGFVEA